MIVGVSKWVNINNFERLKPKNKLVVNDLYIRKADFITTTICPITILWAVLQVNNSY